MRSKIHRKASVLIKPMHRRAALVMSFLLLYQLWAPTIVFALTGGPSQPEVQSFEPVGTSKMVDPFSGSFTYNIPLLKVGGYPINISYHSGITMDQEASWVGLGWNINPGVINRNVRGIPDDFDGEKIEKVYHIKDNKTYGGKIGAGAEFFGDDKVKLGLNASLGVNYNNYKGVGADFSINASVGAGHAGKSPLTGGLGIDANSDEGVTIAPSIGMSLASFKTENIQNNLGGHLGCSFNTRQGLQTLTIGVSDKSSNQAVSQYGNISAGFNLMQPTYTPQVTMPMENTSATGSFKLGGELWGVHPYASIQGYYSCQKLTQTTIDNPAYGYMYSDQGEGHSNAILDFNREKDQPFTASTPDLPVTNFTYDIYSVSGQGMSGSYRPFRSDIGHVFDPYSVTTSSSTSAGGEIGLGNLFHAGVDVTLDDVTTYSGDWVADNFAASDLSFRNSVTNDPLYEPVYFKEASEKSVNSDPAFLVKAGGEDSKSIHINHPANFYTTASNSYDYGSSFTSANYRTKRDIRNQSISILDRNQLKDFGLEDPDSLNLYSGAKGYHIGQITSLGTDGRRYVYEIAAYNTKKEETSFAVGEDAKGNVGISPDPGTGLVTYNPGVDNSVNNKRGVDEYYNNTITPAYAHSYLLTAVLSSDYVDADTVRGPSAGDLGTWTKFNYTKISNFKWRVPVGANKAKYSEGLKSDPMDDKANLVYGEKELWYLHSIETKNYIAIFTTEPRKDGLGVTDENGAINTDTSYAPRLLRKISLYTQPNYKAHLANSSVPLVPIEEVHFDYDYSLCPNVPNNVNYVNNIGSNTGKLTLKKIYFTYQNSFKGELSPYVFNYNSYNPDYDIRAYDRWGFYKADYGAGYGKLDSLLPSEYPYVAQDKALQDSTSSSWTLTDIKIPSGGSIHVDYESNDYAYVQNRPAMEMFKISSASEDLNNVQEKHFADQPLCDPLGGSSTNYDYPLIFPLQKDQSGNYITDISKYFNGVNYLYFRFLMSIQDTTKHKYDYVSGYAPIDSCGITSDGQHGWVRLAKVKLDKHGSTEFSPIVKATIQYGRLNTPRLVFKEPSVDEGAGMKAILKALFSAFGQFSSLTKGLNTSILHRGSGQYCRYFVVDKSWIRLDCPTGNKLGDGARVKDIKMNDEWNDMTSGAESSFDYGQEYSYKLEDGVTSSGVASYEPQIGGDENPWRQPVFYDNDKLLAPDDSHYMETPFGECFFPSPSVGYSRVTVKNLHRAGVHRDATGSVVHEFYTTKDFPTITGHTGVVPPVRDKNDQLSIASLFNIKVKDYMTASQGYQIELNDMNGKPKGQYVYAEGQIDPISSVQYFYKAKPYVPMEAYQAPFGAQIPTPDVTSNGYQLDNNVTVINRDGSIGNANIGMFFDDVADFRQSETDNVSSTTQLNADGFSLFVIPLLIIPMVWPSETRETTRFRSAVTTKVIQRFGILDSTIATDAGSTVKTQNLAYDAQSGQVLLTKTTNDFNDSIFNLTYPAYWYYNNMGAAYQNIGLKLSGIGFNSGKATISDAGDLFAPGDVLALTSGSTGVKAWVISVDGNTVEVEYKNGAPVNGTFDLEIIRSGRRNQQSMDMAKITTLVNPIHSLQSNSYQKVTQASAKEYADSWRTYCNCFDDTSMSTDNPYVLGTKGDYRLKTSFLYLTKRDQSKFDNNTNIRKDGTFSSYSPFYSESNGEWNMTPQGWTYTSTVTDYNPYGQEIEDKDALGRYSSASFGYNQTLPTAVAANSQYKEMGFDGFEDYGFNGCADNHLEVNRGVVRLDATQWHTGRHSLLVSSGDPVTIGGAITSCTPYDPCNLSLCAQNVTGTDTILIEPNGGMAPYTYTWNGADLYFGSDGNPRLVASGGNAIFDISVKDAKGCSYTASNVKITNDTDITGIPQCCNVSLSCYTQTNDTTFVIHPTGGVAPYSYNVDVHSGSFDTATVDNNMVLTEHVGGTMTITVTDSKGCSNSNDLSFDANILHGLPSCCNLSLCYHHISEIAGDIIVSGGVSPYSWSYTILNGTMTVNTAEDTLKLSNTGGCLTGKIEVTATDANGCSVNATDSINCGISNNIAACP